MKVRAWNSEKIMNGIKVTSAKRIYELKKNDACNLARTSNGFRSPPEEGKNEVLHILCVIQ